MKPEDQMPADEMISAWLDGTLDAEGAERMTDLAARDETFANRAERLRQIDKLVRAAVPAEPEIPAALLERLGLAPAPDSAAPGAGVIDLAAARQERAARSAAPAAMPRVRSDVWRMAAQLALVAGIGMAIVVVSRPTDRIEGPEADYRALGAASDLAARQANALVKFAPGVAVADAGKLAAAAGVQLLGSPNQAGAWKAYVAPGRRSAALDALRGQPRVVMAEPIDGASR